jgi:tetratricopeptide (TPR) repeat protein
MRDIDVKLFQAIYESNINDIKALIQNGADVNVYAEAGYNLNYYETPLIVATKKNNIEVIKLLIEHNVDIYKCDCIGNNSLNYACENGYLDLANYYIDKGLVVNPDAKLVRPPLISACGCDTDNVAMVKMLIDKGANVNATDSNGSTPIFVAAANVNKNVIELLIKKGGNPDTYNEKGHFSTPLLVVISKNPKKDIIGTIKLLMQSGAKLGWCQRKAKAFAVNNQPVFDFLDQFKNLPISETDPIPKGDYEFVLANYYARKKNFPELVLACNNFLKQTENDSIPKYFREDDISVFDFVEMRSRCFHLLALVEYENKNFDKCIEYLKDKLTINNKEYSMKFNYLTAECYMDKIAQAKGQAAFETKTAVFNIEEAIKCFNEAKKIGFNLEIDVNSEIRTVLDNRIDAALKIQKLLNISNSPLAKIFRFGILLLTITVIYRLGSCAFKDKTDTAKTPTNYALNECNLRSSPSKGKNIISTIPKGCTVIVLENKGEWLRVRFNNSEGYLKSYLVSTR